MSEKEQIVINAANPREGRMTLSCAAARSLSQEFDIPLKEIGETCNRHGIKIIDCGLGCFK